MATQTDPVIQWLLKGDPAIRWQVCRDLLDRPDAETEQERSRIARAGWGRQILALQDGEGQWGGGLYSPKWTSTTYTLLLLRVFGLPPGNGRARTGALLLLDAGVYKDGGINLWARWQTSSETCVTGMALAIGSRFAAGDPRLEGLVANLLREQMPDGGWNCQKPRGATHSSLHTTISALEGLLEYEHGGGGDREQTRQARERAHEVLYRHQLFRSHRTGETIDERMTRFSFPPQWHYDVLRGLDYLQAAGAARDPRLKAAIELVEKRRRAGGTWPLR